MRYPWRVALGGRLQPVAAFVVSAALCGATVACPVVDAAAQEKIYYFHPDHLGSTSLVTDETGQVVQQMDYGPYGTTARQSGSAKRPQRFTGQRFDADTALYFYQARYYDAQLGRFISPDTLVQAPSDPQTLNRYAYVRGNPTNRTDPTGHWSFRKWFRSLFSPKAMIERAVPTTVAIGSTLALQSDTAAIASAVGVSPAYAGATAAALPHLMMGNFIAAGVVFGATIGAHELLQTGGGRRGGRHVAKEFFDDVVGMSPRTAYIVSSVVAEQVLATGLELAGGALVADYAAKRPYQKGDIKGQPGGVYPFGKFPGGANTFRADQMTTYIDHKGNPLAVFGTSQIELGIFKFLPGGAIHTGGIANTFHGGGMVQIPNATYASYAVCHQATNITLLEGGVANTVMFDSPNWSTTASTLVYGNYGGGLIRAVGAGIQARNDEH